LVSNGLTVGATDPDGFIMPVRGSAALVERAFATPLTQVHLATGETAHVNAVAPSVPTTIGAAVLSVVGLDNAARFKPELVRSGRSLEPHQLGSSAPAPAIAGPQPCSAVSGSTGSGGPYSMTQIAQAYGLNNLYAQGRTGVGQTIALYELERFSQTDVSAFKACYGLHTSVGVRTVDGGAGGSAVGSGEAALDVEDAVSFAPGANVIAYEGPNSGNGPVDVYAAIAD
jgi:kumamolisin